MDEVEQQVGQKLQVAIVAASRLAEQLMQGLEQRARTLEAAKLTEQRELQRVFNAQRKTAAAELAQVHRAEWWERADADRIGQSLATAQAWREHIPEAQQAREKIRHEVLERYQVDIDSVASADPAQVRETLARWEQDYAQAAADAERGREQQDLGNAFLAEAEADWLDANAADAYTDIPEHLLAEMEADHAAAAEARFASDVAYDSAERRADTAAALDQMGHSPEHVEARMTADTANGKPARQAVASQRHTKARKQNPRTAVRQAELGR